MKIDEIVAGSQCFPILHSGSNEIKEPFVFQAFEDNNLTLIVQPKDPNTPMAGCLSFWRKLEHIR